LRMPASACIRSSRFSMIPRNSDFEPGRQFAWQSPWLGDGSTERSAWLVSLWCRVIHRAGKNCQRDGPRTAPTRSEPVGVCSRWILGAYVELALRLRLPNTVEMPPQNVGRVRASSSRRSRNNADASTARRARGDRNGAIPSNRAANLIGDRRRPAAVCRGRQRVRVRGRGQQFVHRRRCGQLFGSRLSTTTCKLARRWSDQPCPAGLCVACVGNSVSLLYATPRAPRGRYLSV